MMMTSHDAAINQSGARTGHMVRGSSPKTAQNQMLTLNAYNSALLQWILILFFASVRGDFQVSYERNRMKNGHRRKKLLTIS